MECPWTHTQHHFKLPSLIELTFLSSSFRRWLSASLAGSPLLVRALLSVQDPFCRPPACERAEGLCFFADPIWLFNPTDSGFPDSEGTALAGAGEARGGVLSFILLEDWADVGGVSPSAPDAVELCGRGGPGETFCGRLCNGGDCSGRLLASGLLNGC